MGENNKKEKMTVDHGGYGTTEINVNYPPNSHKHKEEQEEKPKVKKIISGTAVKRKKSFGKRLLETFVAEDVNSVMSYIIHDVLIPSTKSAIFDMIQGGFEMLLFDGERRGNSRSRRDQNRTYVSYNNYSSSRRDDRREQSYRNRASHNFDDIVFGSRREAEDVLHNLVDLTVDYGQATVADFYEMAGITSNFTDDRYGWTDLGGTCVRPVRDGYIINLPKAILLD